MAFPTSPSDGQKYGWFFHDSSIGAWKKINIGTNADEIPINENLGSIVGRDLTVSTDDPSGGNDGDIWFKYE